MAARCLSRWRGSEGRRLFLASERRNSRRGLAFETHDRTPSAPTRRTKFTQGRARRPAGRPGPGPGRPLPAPVRPTIAAAGRRRGAGQRLARLAPRLRPHPRRLGAAEGGTTATADAPGRLILQRTKLSAGFSELTGGRPVVARSERRASGERLMTTDTWRRLTAATAGVVGAGLLIAGCSDSDQSTPSQVSSATSGMDTSTPPTTPGASGGIAPSTSPPPPTGAPSSMSAGSGYGADTGSGYLSGPSTTAPGAGASTPSSPPVAPPSGGTAGRPRSSGE